MMTTGGIIDPLAGKVALVTGGAVRVGRELALTLARAGLKVAVHYGKSRQQADETVAEIKSLGGEAAPFQAGLRDVQSIPGLMEQVSNRFGRVDILVNSAAIFVPGDLFSTNEESWDEHFAINLKAPFFLAREFVRQLGSDRAGQIVNIVDWRIVRPGADYLVYTLTKSALLTMTKSLAKALAPQVRVNAIAPGAILPPPGKNLDYLASLAEHIPLNRSGSPADVAHALLYLLTADFVTGQLLFVDGGEHL